MCVLFVFDPLTVELYLFYKLCGPSKDNSVWVITITDDMFPWSILKNITLQMYENDKMKI